MGYGTSSSEDCHANAQLLLPWYLAGTLDALDRRAVDRHLAECDDCARDLADERSIKAVIEMDERDAPDRWDELKARLVQGRSQSESPLPSGQPLPIMTSPRPRSRARWSNVRRLVTDAKPLRWIAAAQFAGLLLLGSMLLTPERPGAYHALGDVPAARSGNVLAMFRPQASEAAIRRALTGSDARLVDGPTSAGAYVLAVPGGPSGRQLTDLRRNPIITMAEPIEQAPAE